MIPAIIPAYEPDERMIKLIDELIVLYKGPIVIVNDGSSAEYKPLFDEVCKKGCHYIEHEVNMGKGRALKDAFRYCIENFENLTGCVTADSDGQHKPEDILKIANTLQDKPGSLILGCRNFESDTIPWKSALGNSATTSICRTFCGIKVADVQTGLRGIPKAFMEKLLQVEGERFEFEMRMILISKNAFPITEVPIETIYDSKDEHKTHFRPIRDSIRVYWVFGATFIKFSLASLSSAAIDLLLFQLLCSILRTTVGEYITVATVIARIASGVYNYTVNDRLVFKSSVNRAISFSQYVLLAVTRMLVSAALVTILYRLIRVVPEVVVKAVVDTALFFVGYIIQKKLIFKR